MMAGKHLDVSRFYSIFFSSQFYASMLDHTGSGSPLLLAWVVSNLETTKKGFVMTGFVMTRPMWYLYVKEFKTDDRDGLGRVTCKSRMCKGILLGTLKVETVLRTIFWIFDNPYFEGMINVGHLVGGEHNFPIPHPLNLQRSPDTEMLQQSNNPIELILPIAKSFYPVGHNIRTLLRLLQP